MKRLLYICLLFFLLISTINVFASKKNAPFAIQAISDVTLIVDGSLSIDFKVYFYDSLTWVYDSEYRLPVAWQVQSETNLNNQRFYRFDTPMS